MYHREITINLMLGRNDGASPYHRHEYAHPGFIRPYRKSDLYHVEKMILEVGEELPITSEIRSWIVTHVLKYLRSEYAQASFYLFILGNKIAGLTGFTPLDACQGEVCQLQPLFLKATARRKGNGQKMLEYTIDRAREVGYRRCYLEVSDSLSDAISLVERTGFYRLANSLTASPGTAVRHYMKYIF